MTHPIQVHSKSILHILTIAGGAVPFLRRTESIHLLLCMGSDVIVLDKAGGRVSARPLLTAAGGDALQASKRRSNLTRPNV